MNYSATRNCQQRNSKKLVKRFLTGGCCYVAAVVLSQLLCQLSVLLLSAVLLNCERHYGVRHSKTGQATYT